MSTVAVWMPIYNEEKFLRLALEGVLKQSYTDFKLYVSDNHCTDASIAIFTEMCGTDPRVQLWSTPEYLPGIAHMNFCWKRLNTTGQKYSIMLGGHDIWSPDHLKVLVERMEQELEEAKINNRRVALIYPDTWQLNQEGQLVGHYRDIMQTVQSSPAIPFLPVYAVSGVSSPHVHGLWNEEIRKDLSIRHECSGWDHLIVMHASLRGQILFEGRAPLMMRAPPLDDNLEKYGARHLDPATLEAGPCDFIRQLEWCRHVVDEALAVAPPQAREHYRMLLLSAIAGQYIALRGVNLAITGAVQAWHEMDDVKQIFAAMKHIERHVDKVVGGV
jgi:Glycosyl transferase family 2